MRAWNYRIEGTSRQKLKEIVEKITPTIAATTSSACGLAMVEIFKILQKKKLEAYKDSTNNLSLNRYILSQPAPTEKARNKYDPIEMAVTKCAPPGFTKWDKTVIDQGRPHDEGISRLF
ncbi:unnamed protein product [Choristocarpus tenellus]